MQCILIMVGPLHTVSQAMHLTPTTVPSNSLGVTFFPNKLLALEQLDLQKNHKDNVESPCTNTQFLH